MTVTVEMVQAARESISGFTFITPVVQSPALSEATGLDVFLKAEMLQRTGSFKIRGALNRIAALTPEERERGIVCASSGNHAQAVACAAALFSVQAHIVMAENAAPAKIEATRLYGGNVILHGTIWDDANALAGELIKREGYVSVHPFDDERLVAGQGTLGLELLDQIDELDAVIVPIGGGGLISGVSAVLKQCDPRIKVVGVEAAGAPAMQESIRQGGVATLETAESAVDPLRVARVSELTYGMVSRYVDNITTVTDADIFDALLWTMQRCKLVVEGAGASPVAALLHGAVSLPAKARVVCVLSGGNVDLSSLHDARWN